MSDVGSTPGLVALTLALAALVALGQALHLLAHRVLVLTGPLGVVASEAVRVRGRLLSVGIGGVREVLLELALVDGHATSSTPTRTPETTPKQVIL